MPGFVPRLRRCRYSPAPPRISSLGTRLLLGWRLAWLGAELEMAVTAVQAEASQCLFEFLHMEIVSHVIEETGAEKKGDVVRKLEQLGHRVGESLVERVSRDTPRFKNELDAVVFVCKHLWTSSFNKQIDNLRTNHQDTYVLYDNCFRLLDHTSHTDQYKEEASLYLAFTCGLLMGALGNLGIRCQVTADVTNMPACVFQVKVLL